MTATEVKHGPAFPIAKASRAHWSNAAKIRKQFPEVKTICDAHEPVRIDVRDMDRTGAEPQDFVQCAFAKAACRVLEADGAYIGICHSYIVFGTKAVRFKTPNSVSREITTFDRHQDFATGIYRLSAVSPCARLGQTGSKKGGKKRGPNHRKGTMIKNHMTTRVRSE